MDPPVKNPARTSAQWLRYSATLTTPTSMARQSRVRLMVGLVSRVPLVLNTSVTYICRKAYRRARTVGYKKQRNATQDTQACMCHYNPSESKISLPNLKIPSTQKVYNLNWWHVFQDLYKSTSSMPQTYHCIHRGVDTERRIL